MDSDYGEAEEEESHLAEKSLQEQYGPENACFGCGPANPHGLHIRSFARNSEVVAEWMPQPKYEAFPGVLNGGIIGALLDCHCDWTGAYHLMKNADADHPPCTVTAEYAIKLLRPTPTNGPVSLSAYVVDLRWDRATIEGTLSAGGKICATVRYRAQNCDKAEQSKDQRAPILLRHLAEDRNRPQSADFSKTSKKPARFCKPNESSRKTTAPRGRHSTNANVPSIWSAQNYSSHSTQQSGMR